MAKKKTAPLMAPRPRPVKKSKKENQTVQAWVTGGAVKCSPDTTKQ
jgi:hypothetical protein